MFILNRKTKVIQECNNKDVIKVCQKDIKNYTVAATKGELEEAIQKPDNEPASNPEKKTSDEEQKTTSTGDSENHGDTSEDEQTPQTGVDLEKMSEEEKLEELEAMKADELKKIAKEKGIQGYRNMNKDTLVAMIMNH